MRRHTAIILAALALQYLLGMTVSLYEPLPQTLSSGPWRYVWSRPHTAMHAVLAVFILLLALELYVRAMRRHERYLRVLAGTGLVFVLAAGASGILFLTTHSDAFSYSMSVAFLGAYSTYGWLLARKLA